MKLRLDSFARRQIRSTWSDLAGRSDEDVINSDSPPNHFEGFQAWLSKIYRRLSPKFGAATDDIMYLYALTGAYLGSYHPDEVMEKLESDLSLDTHRSQFALAYLRSNNSLERRAALEDVVTHLTKMVEALLEMDVDDFLVIVELLKQYDFTDLVDFLFRERRSGPSPHERVFEALRSDVAEDLRHAASAFKKIVARAERIDVARVVRGLPVRDIAKEARNSLLRTIQREGLADVDAHNLTDAHINDIIECLSDMSDVVIGMILAQRMDLGEIPRLQWRHDSPTLKPDDVDVEVTDLPRLKRCLEALKVLKEER